MICITGAGGKVGGAVFELLKKTDVPFRLAFNSPRKAEAARAQGYDAVVIDYARPDTLVAGFEGCTKLFLLGPNAMNQSELEVNAINAASAAGVRHVVKLSVLNTEPEDYGFGRVHRVAEKALEASDMSWTFLRASQFMQNLATYMAPTIRMHNAFQTACGNGKLTHLDVDDIARVALHVLTEDGHVNTVYNLTGPEALSYDEVAAALSVELGREITHIHLTDAQFLQGLLAGGTPRPFAEQVVDLDRYFREGGVSVVSNDIETITGQSATTLAQFITETAATGVWGGPFEGRR